MTRAARAFWVMVAATLLLQLAWSFALPTFRGPDEIDHTFRASSLVHGQLLSREKPQDGRGVLVSVSDDLVEAAQGTCLAYWYSEPDNCVPVSSTADGRSSIATAAGSYNPLWYAVAGTVAAPFEGNAADFAMRAVCAVGLALLLGWAASLTTRWDQTGWSLLALVVSITPIVGFSAATAAPNSITIGAGLLLWCAGLTLVERPGAPPLVALLTGAFLLVNTHTTGMIWAVLALLAVFLLRPLGWWSTWIRSDLLRRGGCLVLVGLSVVGELAWVSWADTNSLGEKVPGLGLPSVGETLTQQLVWLFQTVGAFPNRDRPGPVVIYPLFLVPLAVLLVLGSRSADRRTRLAMAVVGAAWIGVPLTLSLIAYRSEGFAWQGRYALPLFAGLALMAARPLALRGRPLGLPLALVVGGTAVAHACSVASVSMRTVERRGSFALAEHLPWAWVLLAAVALVGGLIPLALTSSWPLTRPAPGSRTQPPETSREPDPDRTAAAR